VLVSPPPTIDAGGNPTIVLVGLEPTFPVIVVAPELVIPAPDRTANVSAVVPRRGDADTVEQQAIANARPIVDGMIFLVFMSVSPRQLSEPIGGN
jgi:hypothetical protein